MSAYLVRLKENRELVGFIAAQNRVDLFWLIDECTDPWTCEFRRVGSGGVIFPSTAPQTNDDEWEPVMIDMAGDAIDIIDDEKPWKCFGEDEVETMYRRT